MRNVAVRKPQIDYKMYDTNPYEVDKILIDKYEDKLFNKDEKGFPKLNVEAYEKLSHEVLNANFTKTNYPVPDDVEPESYTTQLWDGGEWVPFSLVIANHLLTRKGIQPKMRIWLDKKWKEFDNTALISFIKEGSFNQFDDFYYAPIPPSNYRIDFNNQTGERTFTIEGREPPRGYTVIRGMEGNYYINPEHFDWMFVEFCEARDLKEMNERKSENVKH